MGRDERADARQRVLSVAGDLFAQHGFDDVTMAQIAEAAGVARATVFNYFGSKYALVEAITAGVLGAYRDLLDDVLGDDATPAPMLLRHICEQMGKGIEAEREFFRGVFRDLGRVQLGLHEGEQIHGVNDEIRSRVLQLVERGQARKELSDDFGAQTLADAFHSLVNGTITDWLYHDATAPLVARLRDAADVFLEPVATAPKRSHRKRGST
jgi:AcrR family transcriptional regulator